jgi:hypothetical protein
MQQNTMFRVHRADVTGKTAPKELAMEWPAEYATVLPKMAGV